jgi:hypothetical protein
MMTEPTVWLPPRQDGETDKSYAALVDYCRLGAGRSLRRLKDLYRSYTGQKPPTRHIGTLKTWSTTHGWQARVSEYDRRAQMADEVWLEHKRQEVRAAALEDAQSLETEWRKKWAGAVETGVIPNDFMHSMLRMRRELDDLTRRVVALPDKVTESKHTGPGKDGAIVHELRPYADLDDDELERVLRG